MNSYLKTYLKFALFILITFTITSLILAVIINFIHLSNFIYHSIINLIAAIIMIIWAFMIVKKFPKNAFLHSLLCSLLFAIVAIILNIDNLNILNSLHLYYPLNSIFKILTSYGSATPTVTISFTP